MSTNASISVQNENGELTSIYLHYDGYESHAFHTLIEHYNTRERAEELVALGDLSGLGNTIEDCKAYKDMGDDWSKVKPQNFSSESELRYSDLWMQYNYIFKDGSWVLSRAAIK